jgi:hypothetical protein
MTLMIDNLAIVLLLTAVNREIYPQLPDEMQLIW